MKGFNVKVVSDILYWSCYILTVAKWVIKFLSSWKSWCIQKKDQVLPTLDEWYKNKSVY